MTGTGDGPDDQRWPTYQPGRGGNQPEEQPEELPEEPPPPPTHEVYRPRRTVVTRVGGVHVIGGFGGGGFAAMIILVVVLGLCGGVVATVYGVVQAVRGVTDAAGGGANAQTPEGFERLVADVEERTGSTEVFRVVVYPDYASVDLPEDRTTQRQRNLYWDGDFTDNDSLGKSTYERIDLADVDPELFADAIERIRARIEGEELSYLIIEGRSTNPAIEEVPSISAYASNEYNEGGYVEIDFDGKLIRETTW